MIQPDICTPIPLDIYRKIINRLIMLFIRRYSSFKATSVRMLEIRGKIFAFALFTVFLQFRRFAELLH
jgi:hypothetical protein